MSRNVHFFRKNGPGFGKKCSGHPNFISIWIINDGSIWGGLTVFSRYDSIHLISVVNMTKLRFILSLVEHSLYIYVCYGEYAKLGILQNA